MKIVWKVLGFIGLLAVLAIANGIVKEVNRSAIKTASSERNDMGTDEALRQASNNLNSGLPLMIDKETRLESTMPGPGKRWTHLYTLVSVNSSEVTQQQLQYALGANIKNGVCTNKEMADFVKSGVQIVYRYRGSDGGIIGDVVVNPQDC